MANPNKSPMKGFIKDIASGFAKKAAPVKKGFSWDRPVSKSAPAQSMNVPRRISENSAAAPAKSNIAAEAAKIVAKRRG
jgi:hypothetical protein